MRPFQGKQITAVVALCGAFALMPSAALAQSSDTSGTPQAAGPTSDVERARVHYDRGIQLFNEENYDAALFEFERAYELAPSFKILYNMARIQRQQNNYSAAVKNFRRYLKEGGANVPDDRRKEVEKEIEVLRPRVATIDIKCNVDGADVYLDDSPVCSGKDTGCIGKTPLPGPVIVNPGRRRISAQKTGYVPGTAVVSVVGGDALTAQVTLSEAGTTIVQKGADLKPVVFWTLTGALAIGAGITGFLSVKAYDDLKTMQETPPGQVPTLRADLDSQRSKMKTLALVTDVMIVGAVISAGFATYFTWFAPKDSEKKEGKPTATTSPKVDWSVTPGGAAVFGTF